MTEAKSAAGARIRAAATDLLEKDANASLAEITRAAGVSRATFYRYFTSRSALLAELEIEPDPDTRQRILAAAAELIGRDGLRGMSMDELAAEAGVSRASVYRLFPGKAVLFDALLAEYSPFAAVEELVAGAADEPPEVVLPAIGQALLRAGGPRIGLLRSLFFEITTLAPEALEVAEPRLREVLGTVAGYLARQIEVGRLRPVHPVIAAQMLVGPIVFHLIARAEMDRLDILELSAEQAVDEFTNAALRALSPAPHVTS